MYVQNVVQLPRLQHCTRCPVATYFITQTSHNVAHSNVNPSTTTHRWPVKVLIKSEVSPVLLNKCKCGNHWAPRWKLIFVICLGYRIRRSVQNLYDIFKCRGNYKMRKIYKCLPAIIGSTMLVWLLKRCILWRDFQKWPLILYYLKRNCMNVADRSPNYPYFICL